MSPHELLAYLQKTFGATLLSDGGVIPVPGDIDLYIDIHHERQVRDEVGRMPWASVRYIAPHKMLIYSVYERNLYIIDITFSFAYIAERYRIADMDRHVRDKLLALENTEGIRALKYFLMQRREEQYIKFVSERIEILESVLSHAFPSIRHLGVRGVRGFMKRDQRTMLSLLGISGWLYYHQRRVTSAITRMMSGRIIAIVGPDGSGKTSLIQPFSTWDIEKAYLGDREFLFQPLYDRLFASLLTKPIGHVLVFGAQWSRIIRLLVRRMQGRIIFCDRYPGYNLGIGRTSRAQKIYGILYAFFPRPDTVVFLDTPSALVSQRSQELTAAQLEDTKTRIRKKLRRSDSIITNSGSADEGSNEILRCVFKIG